MLICNLVFNHDQFNYDKERNIATADFKDLSARRALISPTAQVWNDACDEGFILLGKDGRQSIWTLSSFYNDDDNDKEVAGWWFARYIRNWNTVSDTIKAMRILIIN